MTYVCLLTDDLLESLGVAPECANCCDASWWYRGEEPVVNDRGVKFCSLGCGIEFHRRIALEARRPSRLRACPSCGFDNFEHDAGCLICPAGDMRYGPPSPPREDS